MRVHLDISLFAGPHRDIELVGLVSLCDRMGHTLVTTRAVVRSWTQPMGQPLGQQLELLLETHRTRSAHLAQSTRSVWVQDGGTDWPSARLSLDDAALFLRTPLELLLEDECSDWGFVRRLADPTRRTQLDAAAARGALRVRHGGGITGLAKMVRRLLEPVGQAALDRQRRVRRLRTWVLFDRDASDVDATKPHDRSELLLAECAQRPPDDPWPLTAHRLPRRNIESYLPTPVLAEWAQTENDKARVEALRRCSARHAAAADSYDMKKGLFKDLRCPPDTRAIKRSLGLDPHSAQRASRVAAEARVPAAAWHASFDALSGAQRADLLAGFGNRIGDLYSDAPSRQDREFPEEFDRRATPGQDAASLIESILEQV